MDFGVKITGLAELDRTLGKMARSTQRKVYSRSLREGAKIVKDAASDNIRQVSKQYTGLLSKKSSIAVYNAKKYRGNYRVLVQIKRGLVNNKVIVKDSKTGLKGPVRVGLYASVLEYGSSKLNRRPRPWIRKALRENENRALIAIQNEFNKRLNEAVLDARR